MRKQGEEEIKSQDAVSQPEELLSLCFCRDFVGLCFLQRSYNFQTLLSWPRSIYQVPELSELLLTLFFLISPFLKYIFPGAQLCPAVGPLELADNSCVQYSSASSLTPQRVEPLQPHTASAWAPVHSTHEISVIRP